MRRVQSWLSSRPLAFVALAVVFIGSVVYAGNLVDQGSPGSQGSWFVNTSARVGGATTEVLVLNSAATTVPSSALLGRRSVEIQNLGPNTIYCTLGGGTPVLTKSRALTTTNNTWAFDVSDAVLVKCISATADQVTGAATIVTEIR